MAARTWRCGACLSVNQPRTRRCAACLKARPKKRRPAHLKALELPYEQYVVLNGGNVCGICQTAATGTRRLDRDHDHKTATPRGLLHARCNRALPSWVTPEWLEAAAAYLRRAA
jgi:epoxyqueuosine reductase QueG